MKSFKGTLWQMMDALLIPAAQPPYTSNALMAMNQNDTASFMMFARTVMSAFRNFQLIIGCAAVLS